MSHFMLDPDEWETVWFYKECPCGGLASGNCNGCCCAMAGSSQRRRDPEEVKRIKADRERKREDAVLAEADVIRARRSAA